MNKRAGKKEGFDYLAELLLWALGGAMFIYLGYRTLHFLGFTFAEEDQIYSYLGLFSTTIGAVIFAVSFKRSKYFDLRPASAGGQVWREDAFKKMVSMVMMVVCALGELGLAFADMSLVTAQRGGAVTMTEGELITYMWLTAGLAAAVGGAVFAIKLHDPNPKADPIVDMSDKDADNNGVLDSRQTTPIVRQFNYSDEQIAALRNILGDAPVGQGSNGNGAVDPTKAAR
jgi:hypothetical protein